MKNILKPIAKSVLIPLRLTAAASATDAAIHKKMFGSGTTTLVISNEKMNDVIKTVTSPRESSILIKSVGVTKNEAKKQKGGLLKMLLGTFGARLLGNLLTVKETTKAGEGTTRTNQDFRCRLIS